MKELRRVMYTVKHEGKPVTKSQFLQQVADDTINYKVEIGKVTTAAAFLEDFVKEWNSL